MTAPDAAVIGQRIRALRDSHHMSLDVLYAEMCARLPRWLWTSTEMVRRIETGKRDADPIELIAIADVFAVDAAADLAPERAEDLRNVAELFERTVTRMRWITSDPRQSTLFDGDLRVLVAA